MSFFTNLLETIPHFQSCIEEKELELKTTKELSIERLQLLVELAYCYAYVQLQKGQAFAEEAIALAERINDQSMKGNALCAKAMNQFRIGYVTKAQTTAWQALLIFENINDEEGKCDAYFQLGSMPYLSIGPGDTSGNLEKAYQNYAALDNRTGMYLVLIQQSMQLFFIQSFEEGTRQVRLLMKELSEPYQPHLFCFAHMQLSLGMHMKQDLIEFMNHTLAWQKVALSNGNFHDYCMTKAMLTDCYRFQHLDQDVMQGCLESIECCEKLGSIHGHSTVYIVMAHIVSGQSQYEDALLYYQKAIEAAQEIEDDYKYLMALNAAGEIYLKLGQNKEANDAFHTAREKSIIAKDRINLITAQRHLAELAYKQGEFDRAFFEFKLFFDNGNNNDGWNVQDYGNYAATIAKASDAALQQAGFDAGERYTLRLKYLEKYLELAQHQKNKREEVNAFNSLAEYYEDIDDLSRAIQYRKKYTLLYEELVNEKNMRNMAKLRLQYETEKKEQEMELLKKENEQALLKERLRISRELHDDIGSTLGSISIYSEVAKGNNGKNKNAREALAKIGYTSRGLIDKMSDIVWSLNPNNENVEQLQSRMASFSAMTLTPANINYEFFEYEEVEKIKLGEKHRKSIFLIFKEAIYNIAKYAECKKVNISLSIKGNAFNMAIKDDGIGFNVHAISAYNGNGLKNMRARAEEIGASLHINSNENTGTLVELIVSL